MAQPSDGSWVLPKDFLSMNDILDGKKSKGSFVNVAGLVRDVQLPIKSRGTDYKMRISLIDKSVESNGSELSIHIFADKDDMPTVSLSDVVLVRSAKVQLYNNEYSLIVHMSTSFYVYPAETIPPLPLKALPPLRPCGINKKNKALAGAAAQPSEHDRFLAAQLFHAVDKTQFPTQVEFKEKVDRTLNVANKDSSLGGLVGGYPKNPKFYDLLVNVVYISSRPSGDGFDSYVPLWVTDYTENPLFREFPLPDDLTDPDAGSVQGQPGDAYDYLTKYERHNSRLHSKNNKKDKGKTFQWPGPFGRRCMQIACYEPHATYVRESVRAGDWVQLRNVRVGMGTNGLCLEGFMANDEARGNPIRVERIEMAGMELEDMSIWHQKALRRKQKYQQHLATLKKKSQKRKAAAMAADGEGAAEAKTAKNAKQRRQEMRARKANGGGASGGASGSGQQSKKQTSTNQSVVSEHTDQAVTPLATVLEPLFFKLQDDKEAILPFANLNFRARVRVVDFLPERLQDFAVSRRTSEFDILPDMDGDDSVAASSATSDDDEDDDEEGSDADKQDGTLNRFVGEAVWEWRFALLLEDASDPVAPTASSAPGDKAPLPPAPRRIWAVVDNSAAQLLTGLDACDLRHDGKTLQALKAKMFLLWGNLDESKQQARAAAREAKNAAAARAAKARKAAEAKKAAAAAAEERKRERQRHEELKQRQKEEEAQRQREVKQQQAAQGLRRYPAPPLESDDEGGEDEVMGEERAEEGGEAGERPGQATEEGADTSKDTDMADAPVQPQPPPAVVRNLPFVCCLRQYGVQVRTAADGKKRAAAWKQMFALFGTQIKGI